ncbi:MAG: type III-B CRISPR module RAMP protein Cmr4 [Bacteroidetes bacterium]|nr:MAG: type III-B CRISPR module RAMP protein Cmr4 [Bacteroidota bacterium]
MTTRAYLITCLTNMHVGVGGTNYDIIDNAVQRDVTTGLPTIFSSSLKGALREYCRHYGLKKEDINYIFGSDEKGESNVGNYNILPADLLSFPVRAKGIPYYNATAKELIAQINYTGKALGLDHLIDFSEEGEMEKPKTKREGQRLEEYTSIGGLAATNQYIGDNIAVFHYNDLQYLTERLPVIARNQLENGQSKNLWYEEVVPKASRFVFFVKIEENNAERLQAFEALITKNPVQIGANGSIGYGFCCISKIEQS